MASRLNVITGLLIPTHVWPCCLPPAPPLILVYPATLNSLLFLSMPRTLTCQNFVSSCTFHLEHLASIYHLANALRFSKSLLPLSMHLTLFCLYLQTLFYFKHCSISSVYWLSLLNILIYYVYCLFFVLQNISPTKASKVPEHKVWHM